LGKRKNDPLKGEWFTLGGRIYKNDTWQNTLLRISKVELGLRDILVEDFSVMGIWDHFYENSAFSQDISTHNESRRRHLSRIIDPRYYEAH
jgi:colanic acid biosynthesis protein WcaH